MGAFAACLGMYMLAYSGLKFINILRREGYLLNLGQAVYAPADGIPIGFVRPCTLSVLFTVQLLLFVYLIPAAN